MEINNINLTDPVGNKGDITNEVIPSVLSDAPCASSILSLRETSCFSETVSVIEHTMFPVTVVSHGGQNLCWDCQIKFITPRRNNFQQF